MSLSNKLARPNPDTTPSTIYLPTCNIANIIQILSDSSACGVGLVFTFTLCSYLSLSLFSLRAITMTTEDRTRLASFSKDAFSTGDTTSVWFSL
mgnify:FL=1